MLGIVGALIIAAQVSIDTAKVSQTMIAELQRTRAPGAAIGIIVDGKLAFARGYGRASAEHTEVVGDGTLFRIGSVTKVLTGLTALGSERRIRGN